MQLRKSQTTTRIYQDTLSDNSFTNDEKIEEIRMVITFLLSYALF
jgi:hypothetical protein